ncbi:MAG TPA: FCD domain-containing protein [Nakamurella sp.]|nr:FCD domain-containing protein [Nakamurella sp.]
MAEEAITGGDGAPHAEGATRAPRRGPRRPLRPRVSRSDQLQQSIKDLIVARGLSAGDPLPTEFDLVDELGVSRNSLREALKALQAVGIVEIRHGFGMYVGRMSLGALVDELAFHSRIAMRNDHRDLANVIYLREVLESGLVRRLVVERPDADHGEVAAVIEQMDAEARDGFVAPETDRRFHEVLYRPLGNPLVAQLLGAFWDVYFQLKDDLGPMIEPAPDVARRHRDIYLAVLAGDAPAAQAAMTAHFDGVRIRLRALEPADR